MLYVFSLYHRWWIICILLIKRLVHLICLRRCRHKHQVVVRLVSELGVKGTSLPLLALRNAAVILQSLTLDLRQVFEDQIACVVALFRILLAKSLDII